MQPSSASVFGSPASGIKFLLESMDGLGVLQVPAFVQVSLSLSLSLSLMHHVLLTPLVICPNMYIMYAYRFCDK